MRKKTTIKEIESDKNNSSLESSEDLKFIKEFIKQKKSQNKILKEIIEKINKTDNQSK
jgi:hypothetical protein